jgi:hypothetical protein
VLQRGAEVAGVMIRAYSYPWFLPKAYSWLTKLLSQDKVKEIESAHDLKSYINSLRGTRLSGHIPFTSNPRIIDLSIRSFYKKEINALLSLVPGKDAYYIKVSLLPIFVKELFHIYRTYLNKCYQVHELYKNAFLTISPSAVEKLCSHRATLKASSTKELMMLAQLIDDPLYRNFLLGKADLIEENIDSATAEVFYYFIALNTVAEKMPDSPFSPSPREIVCPYVDLNLLRTASSYILARGGFPGFFEKLGRTGCYGLELLDLAPDEKTLVNIYVKVLDYYGCVAEGQKSIFELDHEAGLKMSERVIKASRKAFASYPFSPSVPLALLHLLLGEKDFLLSQLSRIILA